MIEIGKVQTLVVTKESQFGVYLNEKPGMEDHSVLLPKGQVREGTKLGDSYEVFIYRDSKDRIIATINRPKLTIGQFALLKVTSVSNIGAFVDWGLEKELFLPYKQQIRKVEEGEEYLFGLYVDKSDRLCATMDIHYLLETNPPYVQGDWVEGRVYTISESMGVFVAVDDKYMALIPPKEVYETYSIGQVIKARVALVKEDGKIDLSVRQQVNVQMDDDAVKVLDAVIRNGGVLYLHDKSNAEDIKEQLSMSKSSFKRAIGRLFKNEKITICDDCIKIK
ncbi:MAG: RNA-binding protein [Clostridiales bacterium]|jgi:predicted RNA-binding protein (virulence factor B family)|nr:RNA-binding protein [Clostridiales bacterium]